MAETLSSQVCLPTSELAAAIHNESGVDVNLCFQCGKCAAGCPIAYAMDHPPAQLIHAARLGVESLVLESRTIWLCAACETCTTRCPQGVDIARVMDAAKIIAVRRGYAPAIDSVRSFHKAALANIRHFGRMWEAGMIVSLKIRTRDWFKDMDLGRKMLLKGKLKLLPSLRGKRRAARIFARVQKVEREAGRPS